LGSGGKRVRILAGSLGESFWAVHGPGRPLHVRAMYFPLARSASTTFRMKFVMCASPVAGAALCEGFCGAEDMSVKAKEQELESPGILQ